MELATLVSHRGQAVVAHTFNPSPQETEADGSLGYMKLISLKEKQSQAVVAHTFNPSIWESPAFNPSTKEVETGRDMAGQREEYKAGGDRSSSQSD